METIIIKTQKELDALPDSFNDLTTIEIRPDERITIKVSKVYGCANIIAYGIADVNVYGSVSIEVYDSVRVEAYNSASVRAFGLGKVEVYDSASVEAYDSVKVEAYHSSSVDAYDSVKVRAFQSANVRALNSTIVEAFNSVSVRAFGSANVFAHHLTRVEAYSSVSVSAYNKASVSAYNEASVKARGSSNIRAYDSANVVAYNSTGVVAYKSANVSAYNEASVWAYNKASVKAYDSASVVAHDSASVWAYNEASVSLFISAYLIVHSPSVVINSLLDHSTAVFKGCPIQIKEKSDTAQAREIPSTIEVSFNEWLKRGYVVADGIHKKLISQKTIGDNTIFKVQDFPKKTKSYVVKRGDLFSHGETAEKAISDLRFKISDRDLSEFEHWKVNPDIEITENEAIQGYRIITGACELGVREFIESIKIPKKLTPNIVLDLTKDKFGNARFARFLENSSKNINILKRKQ